MANLGTLTVDLVARTAGFVQGLDAASRESAKLRRRIQKDFEVIGRAAGIGVTAATTALVALTKNTIDSARELQQFSAISQTSTREFQRFAAGAERVGISNEKLADIFKDVNDRVGDFLITGAGPLADFFEVIAPRVGVTADQFRDLSGPQALGLFVDTLERAGANTNEFTFFLESVASDATALLPLLANNAELLQEFGDQAERAGTILDDDLISSSIALDAIIQDVQRNIRGLGTSIAQDTLPAILGISEAFLDAANEADGFDGSGELVRDTLVNIASGAVAAAGAFQILGRGLATSAAAFAALGRQDGEGFFSTEGLKRAAGVLDAANEDITGTFERYQKLFEDIRDIGSGDPGAGLDDIGDKAESAEEKLARLQAQIQSAFGSGVGVGNAESTGIVSTIEALERQALELQKGAEFVADYELQIAGATEEQRAYAAQLRDTIRTLESEAEVLDEFNKRQAETNEQARQIERSLRTEEEAIRDSYERRRQIILDNTEITGQARENLLLRLETDTQEKLGELNRDFWANYAIQAKEALESLDQVAANTIGGFASDFGSAIEGIVFDAESLDDALFRLFDGFARAGINALAELGAQWLIYQLVVKTSQSAAQASAATTISANAVAQQQLAALNAFASTAAIPITGPALAPAAAAAALAATTPFVTGATTAALSGIAHDGLMSVPQTGTFLLEKGERVLTSETSANLDQTLNRMQGGGDTRIINAIDPNLIGDYISSSSGEKVVVNVLRKNPRLIKALASA